MINAKINNPTVLKAKIYKARIIETVGDDEYETYSGEYEITPSVETQTLGTTDKVMDKDITILKVPTTLMDNNAGGQTFTIL